MTKIAAVKPKQRKLVVGFLLLACALMSGNASAQVSIVTDPGHTMETIIGWSGQYTQKEQEYARQGQQLAQQVQQYETQVKQFEQMYVKGGVFQGKPGYREKLEVRPINQGVSERCGDAPASNPVGTEQLHKCIAIVQTENRRYNATVKMLEDVEKRDEELKAALAEREDIKQDEKGKLESNTNRILAMQTQQQNDVQNASNLLSAYDATLRSLREDQIQTANLALKGNDSLLGGAIQGAALHAALEAARQRDR